MRTLTRLLSTVVLLAGVQWAHAEGSWQGIPFGSSVEDVLSKGKELGIVRESNPKRVPPVTRAPNGLYSPLKIPEFVITGSKYEVNLIFDAKTDELFSVSVTYAEPDKSGIHVRGLRNALIEKYGQPVTTDVSSFASTAVWHTPEAHVTLYRFGIDGQVSLTYAPPGSRTESRL
jgi:hypothetical protein